MGRPVPGRYHPSNIEPISMQLDYGGKEAVQSALHEIPDGTMEMTITVTERADKYRLEIEYVEP